MNSIEHGTSLSDNTLKLMHERNVCFAPTLAASAMGVNPTSDSPDAVELAIRTCAMLPRARETTRHARQMGVNIIAGSDSGHTPDDPQHLSDAIAELVLTEMTPMEAIQAATSRSAECLGISKRAGVIRPGLEADLIVLDRNPLDDINAVGDVLLVVNDGTVAINRLKF